MEKGRYIIIVSFFSYRKRVQMGDITKEQMTLRQELNKLSKRANQRILEIERLTKRKSPQFAVKELADLLSATKRAYKKKRKICQSQSVQKNNDRN